MRTMALLRYPLARFNVGSVAANTSTSPSEG
jgi:hypothetical protein